MTSPPSLLNDDGSVSMATMFMMSHHGFRRDLGRFARALAQPEAPERASALREEWSRFKETLHGHHHAEDTGLFPGLSAQFPEVSEVIASLRVDHSKIDPLVAAGEDAFAELPRPERAAAVVRELSALLEPHLATEEAKLIPLIRGAKSFPPPATDAEAELYAQGFAWSSNGIAPDILEKVYALLPENLTSRLPAAVAAFEARCEKVWGSSAAGASRTPIPDFLQP